MLTVAAGCANHGPRQAATPASQPTAEWRDSYFRFDDPRCSDNQRRAIRAATKAVIGSDQPTASVAERLHSSCTESADGWSLTVWQFGPNEVPVPGGFTGVLLNRDFSVRSVVGGA